MEARLRGGAESYASKDYTEALKQFTRAMILCPCTHGVKRPRCICKDFEAVAAKNGSILREALYRCACDVGKTFKKCRNPLHIKALDYRAGTFEALKALDRARKDAEWMLELAPRLPDGYLRLGKIARLQKKSDFARKIYASGIEASDREAPGAVKKLQQLRDALKPLEARLNKRDPLWLPLEMAVMVFANLSVPQLTKCLQVSKSWNQTLQGVYFKNLWSSVIFPRSNSRPPANWALHKIVARTHGSIREIEVVDTLWFQLTPQKLDTLLRNATSNLERLVVGPLLTYDYSSVGSYRFKKLRHLAAVTDNTDGRPRHGMAPNVGVLPTGLITGIAQTLVHLHLLGIPQDWHNLKMPMFPKLKYLRLEHKEKLAQNAFPIFDIALMTPHMEQLSLKGIHLTIGHFWQMEPAWEQLWNKLKVFVFAFPLAGRPWQPQETTAALSMMMSVNHGTTFEHFDHDIAFTEGDPWSPAKVITTTYDWSNYTNGNIISLPVVGHAKFPKMREFRVQSLAHIPDKLEAALQDAMANRHLHTLDIVFDLEDMNSATGTEHVEHLKKYNWLRGLDSIHTLGVFGFRFKQYPRKDEDLPLPGFLATFPNLETLSLGSESYDDAEFCFVVEAIMKVTHLKTIYQQNVGGAAWDRLVKIGKQYGVQIIPGPRPKEWPVKLDEDDEDDVE
ncbi:hypothetical protein PLICBS_010440 [Purpureocillium lilacinum]|uniref:uncharacterized protein n=1 Tax=Purpureocillium lilacinum TaxID=33203 RepID=UPI00208B577F|nr:hypothetical protein PLICBS_010440 [Purpureocillium lilacinum]